MNNKTCSTSELKKMREHLIYGGTWAGPLLVKGEGCKVRDLEGKEYIDCTSQAWTLNTGHSNKKVIEAAFEQARRLGHLRGGHNSIPRLMLAKRLADIAPERLNKVGFTVGGSSSIESALKIALLNHPGAQNFITLYNAWHGTSLTTLSASWPPTRTTGEFTYGTKFFPFIENRFIRVPNPYCFRCYFDQEYPNCNLMCAKMLRLTIEKATPGPVAGVLLEPLQGNGGQIPAPSEYLHEVRRICDENDILLIYDEIQTAFGRMGTMFAAEYYDVIPDVICVAKSMANGFAIGGVIVDERLKVFDSTGEDVHTFGNSPMVQAAALANIEYIQRENLPERAKRMGEYITQRLKALQKEFPQIGDIRGPGLHIGVELVKDPETKEPAGEITHRLYDEAMKRGVILGLAGAVPNVVKIKPPLTITKGEVDKVLEVFGEALKVIVGG